MSQETKKYQPKGKELKRQFWGDINIFAKELLKASKKGNVWGNFNGVIVELKKGSTLTIDEVVQKWSAIKNKQEEDWRKSPEGIAHDKKIKEEAEMLQAKADQMIRYIEGKNDNLTVKEALDWLYDSQEWRNMIDIKKLRKLA